MKTFISQLRKLAFISVVVIPFNSLVHADHLKKHDDKQVRFFSTFESNGNDTIQGVGIGMTFKNSKTDVGFQVNTSLNNAEVRATDGYIEEYFAWQGSAKVGLFSRVSVYFEAGIDLTELIFHDFRYDDHDEYHNYYEDNIDVFVGIGAGIQLGHLKVEGFGRIREIDSQYWEAESEVFTGVQFSFNF